MPNKGRDLIFQTYLPLMLRNCFLYCLMTLKFKKKKKISFFGLFSVFSVLKCLDFWKLRAV